MTTSMSFIVPRAFEEYLPVLRNARVCKMPARMRLAERVVRVDSLVMYKARTGKLYCDSVVNGAFPIFSGAALSRGEMRKRRHLRAMHELGELPDEEWELLVAYEEVVLDARARARSAKWAIDNLERANVDPPDGLLALKARLDKATPDPAEWIVEYTQTHT